ncbi:MAG: crossover junction endodeoxyribonuclease RuvC [Planctomycetes bacterium]|nr:crossover junction endodeoxyribonuclease RuvC [Planctomycetota bacterium]
MAGSKRKATPAPRVAPAEAARSSGAPDERCLVPPDCTWPVILGVDPGTRSMGYGAIVIAPDGPRLLLAGVIAPRAGTALAERLAEISVELPRVLARCRPSWLVVERAFSALNVQSAFRIGESRGVVLACAARAAVPIAEYSPAQAKKAVLGHGSASKEQVAAMLPRLLRGSVQGLPDDATDALALALTHARKLAFERRMPVPRSERALAVPGRARSNNAVARVGRPRASQSA